MLGSLRAWKRRHTTLVDALVIAPLALFCLFAAPAYSEEPDSAGPVTSVVLTILLLLPLLWRVRLPRETFALVAAVSFVQYLLDAEPMPANFAVLVAMYGVASRCALPWSLAAGVITEFGMGLALDAYDELTLELFLNASVTVGAVWIGGIYANTRRRYVEGLVERAERAERERDQQAMIATAAERARIARELHDVVAHNVSVIVVQADGAGYAIDTDPAQARRAMKTISSTGRQALAEMRRLVGVLRDDAAIAEEYQPQPGLGQLEGLAGQVRAAGLPVDMVIDGDPAAVPEGEQLVIYRIVQEALTNTLKHGGPDARASVEVGYGAFETVIRVLDDGRGAAAPRGRDGHGLIGMRERVALYGGSVEAAPKTGGGFSVVARVPSSRAVAAS